MGHEKSFGDRIRELRQKKLLSLRDVEKQTGVDFTYLSKLENNKMPAPGVKVIRQLAEFLGADVEELIALAGKTPPALEKTLQNSEAARSFIYRHAGRLTDKDWDSLTKFIEEKKKGKPE